MNAIQLKYFALIHSCNARVEGMKAENLHRISGGNSITYGQDAFESIASELETLAKEVVQL